MNLSTNARPQAAGEDPPSPLLHKIQKFMDKNSRFKQKVKQIGFSVYSMNDDAVERQNS